jgi:hypothetical protein
LKAPSCPTFPPRWSSASAIFLTTPAPGLSRRGALTAPGCYAPSCVEPWPRRAAPRSPHRVDVTKTPSRTKADPVCGRCGRSPKGKMLVANRHRSGNRRARRPPPGGDQGLFHRLVAWLHRGRRRPGRYDSKPTAGRPCIPPPTSGTSHVVGAMAAHAVLPRIHRAFSNAKTWALRGYRTCDRRWVLLGSM